MRAGEVREQWLAWAHAARATPPSDRDLEMLETWLADGGRGEPPLPSEVSHLARMTAMSLRVAYETRDWSAAQYRKALVQARMRG